MFYILSGITELLPSSPFQDKRLEGGYEAVPTRDIHMKQVGLDRQWLYILKEYVRPLQELIFTGYYHNVSLILSYVLNKITY